MCGANQIFPYYDDLWHLCVKKISPNGTLLINKFLPLRHNVYFGFITDIGNGMEDKFLVVNPQRRFYNPHNFIEFDLNCLRYT
jgi:hypothetical protein